MLHCIPRVALLHCIHREAMFLTFIASSPGLKHYFASSPGLKRYFASSPGLKHYFACLDLQCYIANLAMLSVTCNNSFAFIATKLID